MAVTPKTTAKTKPKHAPARTPEAQERHMISMAFDLAEKRLEAGTASAQEITHFLKLGSSREQLEQDKLKRENDLLNAKKEHLESQNDVKELYQEALKAMRSYSGNGDDEDYYE